MSNLVLRRSQQPAIPEWCWFIWIFFAGIDGFKLLEPLRELGARPFFVLYPVCLVYLASRGIVVVNISRLFLILALYLISALGLFFYGIDLKSFGGKEPAGQFVAQGFLFLLGFSPVYLIFRGGVEQKVVVRSAILALGFHLIFILIDYFTILTNLPRPFETSFLASNDRPFPTGLFSEPSYVAAYLGILLPALLYRSSVVFIFLTTIVVSVCFFLGDVRSFFMVYGAGMVAMMIMRWGWNSMAMLVLPVVVLALVIVGIQLNVASVEDNLSSAYRLGNTYSFFVHAVWHDWLLGDGFGSTHFIYSGLSHPDFIYLSKEFDAMIAGDGFRVPVFNLWVRLFAEIGVVATFFLLWAIARRFRVARVSDFARIIGLSSLVFSASTDSYIYGMFTLGLLFLFSIDSHRNNSHGATVRCRR